jgi:hypothetical protein
MRRLATGRLSLGKRPAHVALAFQREGLSMKPIKFAVLGSSVLATIAVFTEWAKIEGDFPSIVKDALPTSGMGNGGPVFLFLLAFPLAASAVGSAKRFSRGLAITSFVGALLATLVGLAKYSDISHAGDELSKIGATGTITAAPGYWVFFVGALVTALASLAGIVRPEPKLAAAPAPGSLAIRGA